MQLVRFWLTDFVSTRWSDGCVCAACRAASRPVITQTGAPSGNRKDLPITSPVTLMTPGLARLPVPGPPGRVLVFEPRSDHIGPLPTGPAPGGPGTGRRAYSGVLRVTGEVIGRSSGSRREHQPVWVMNRVGKALGRGTDPCQFGRLHQINELPSAGVDSQPEPD